MKRLVQTAFVGSVMWVAQLSAQTEPAGLLIYQEPPGTYTEAFDYHSIRKDNALYFTLVALDGQKKQLRNGGLLATIKVPPLEFDAGFPKAADAAITKIKDLTTRYPQVKSQLDLMLGKWERAQSAYAQGPKQPAAAITEQPVLPELVVAGKTYQAARLLGSIPGSAEIAHAGGITRLQLSDLTQEQIQAINSTSKTVQISTEPEPPADSSADRLSADSFAGRVSAAGAGGIRFVAAKTGLGYQTLSAWVLFILMPAFIVLLLLWNLIQHAKIRSLTGNRGLQKR